MDINTVCTLLIDALKGAGYNDSTVFNYQGTVRRFKAFYEEHDVTEYNHEIGKLYADAVVSPKTGKFSKERYFWSASNTSTSAVARLRESFVSTCSFLLTSLISGILDTS